MFNWVSQGDVNPALTLTIIKGLRKLPSLTAALWDQLCRGWGGGREREASSGELGSWPLPNQSTAQGLGTPATENHEGRLKSILF